MQFLPPAESWLDNLTFKRITRGMEVTTPCPRYSSLYRHLYQSVAPHISIPWEDLTITLRILHLLYTRNIRYKNTRESRPWLKAHTGCSYSFQNSLQSRCSDQKRHTSVLLQEWLTKMFDKSDHHFDSCFPHNWRLRCRRTKAQLSRVLSGSALKELLWQSNKVLSSKQKALICW